MRVSFVSFSVLASFVCGLSGCSESAIPSAPHELCAEAPTDAVSAGFKSDDDVNQFLKDNGVTKVNAIPAGFGAQFSWELKKFPETLRKHMVRSGREIRVLTGNGVGEDPKFPSIETTGKDSRRYRGVPGTGGPVTTIVVNKLYQGHGSSSLVLHEHAHTLDYLGVPGRATPLSSDPEWQKIIAEDGVYRESIADTCGEYCTSSPLEAFAETFSMYYACEKSRAIVERSPRVVKFLESLAEAAK